MKPVAGMTRLELAAFIADEVRRRGINVVLSGGSCVSIYSSEKYVSQDLDFMNAGFAKRAAIREAMKSLGFTEKNRYFYHPNTTLLIEFPPGPLGVGGEPVKQIDELQTETGVLRIISATDCVKDRLTWYYHDGDVECLRQAVLVASHKKIEFKEIERWSKAEGKGREYLSIRDQLKKTV